MFRTAIPGFPHKLAFAREATSQDEEVTSVRTMESLRRVGESGSGWEKSTAGQSHSITPSTTRTSDSS